MFRNQQTIFLCSKPAVRVSVDGNRIGQPGVGTPN